MLLTIDPSVIVAGILPEEAQHEICRTLLESVRFGLHAGIEPFSVLVEVAAAVARRTGRIELSRRAFTDLEVVSGLTFMELTQRRAGDAADLAMRSGLRGMDALVAQVAREFNATLVTLDRELAQRAAPIVSVREGCRGGLATLSPRSW